MLNYKGLEELDCCFKKAVKTMATAGLNACLITPQEKWMKSYGYKQINPSLQETTMDTIWDLASISKVLVTATCIMKLKEEGLLTLESKIVDFLPEFQSKKTKILQCLTHTSGFPADINGYKTMSKEEMIQAAMNIHIEEEWKEKVHYSDVNYILLGLVIKSLKGSLSDYAKKVMFEPLQMNNTTYNPESNLKERCASYEFIENRGGVIRGVVHDGKAFKLGGVSGHAGVFSTIEDVSHYVEMMLNEGVYHGEQFFSKETMELYKTCLTPNKNESRSVGWVLSDANYPLGHKYSEHTLFHTGFSGPSILIDLDKKMGIIVLANRVHPTRENKLILTMRSEFHDFAYKAIEGEGNDAKN